jgi:AbrB family looped-hinge helix DNA binding protein
MVNEFRTKLGDDGRIVIPAGCRKLLQLVAGEELIIKVENEGFFVTNLKSSIKKAQALVKKYAKNQNLVDKLKALREEDTQHG